MKIVHVLKFLFAWECFFFHKLYKVLCFSGLEADSCSRWQKFLYEILIQFMIVSNYVWHGASLMYIFIITIINRVIRKVEMFFFFQKSLNLFTCDMRKWKKNMNIRRAVLFLSNLESISQFGKIIVHRNWTIFDIGIVARVSTVLLTFPGIAKKTERKVFQLSAKLDFHPQKFNPREEGDEIKF